MPRRVSLLVEERNPSLAGEGGVACEAKLYGCEGWPNLLSQKKITNHKSKREIVIAATAKPGFLIMCHRTSFAVKS